MSQLSNPTENMELSQLLRENQQLRQDCAELKENQDAMETAIAASNKQQLLAEISSMELEHILASVTDAIWIIRDDGIVVRANDAMFELLGKPAEEVIGHICSELLDYGSCYQQNCPLEICKTRKKQEFDIVIPNKGNVPRHYILNAAPMLTIIGTAAIICQFKDITSRKETEQKLEEANRLLSQMARMDGLTQIANRRYFDEVLEQEWQRLNRSGKPLSLILIDIDFFKKFNDCYGHQAGDDCLFQVAQALKSAVKRPADLAARYGGEEFVLLLPEIDIDGVLHVGSRVLATVAALQIEHCDSGIDPFVTLSLGAATMQPSAECSAAELLAAADKALYEAKAKGRNRLVVSDHI